MPPTIPITRVDSDPHPAIATAAVTAEFIKEALRNVRYPDSPGTSSPSAWSKRSATRKDS